MLRLWRLCRPEADAGALSVALPSGGALSLRLPAAPGPLPDAGGLLDQAAIMMDALDAMTAAARERRRRHGRDGTS